MRRSPGPGGWLALAAALLLVAGAARLALTTDLYRMVPQGDPVLARAAAFFAAQGGARLLPVEASVDDPAALPAARRHLEALAAELAPLSVAPERLADPAALARAAAVVHDHLPVLVGPERLQALAADLAPAALEQRLAALKVRASRPDQALAAVEARREVLGLAEGVLAELRGAGNGVRVEGALLLQGDGRHALSVFAVPWDPADADATAALLERVERATAAAAADGVRLEALGAFRHYRENLQAVQHDLLASLPLTVVAVAAILWSLLGLRAVLAALLPAALAVAGGLGALGWLAWPVPVALLAFAAAVFGIAIDYGIHAAAARRTHPGAGLGAALLASYCTTGAAFAMLLFSAVPALRCLGVLVSGGLAVGLAAALWLIPLLLPQRPVADPWRRCAAPLLAWCDRAPRRRLLLAVLLTLVLAPGLARLGIEGDLRRFDGSRPATWAAESAALARWGAFGADVFLVAEAADPDTALAAVAAARAGLGGGDELLQRLLPHAAERARRRAAWNAWWTAHGDELRERLAAACAATGLRAAAFDLAPYRPLAADPGLPDWQGTPVAAILADRLRLLADGRWQAASPLPTADRELAAVRARLAQDHPAVALVAKADLGQRLVALVREDLLRIGLLVAAVVLLVVAVAMRRPRLIAAVILPPLVALAWTFGLLGWCGVALTPLAVLAAAWVGGVGIDAAIFLAGRQRAHALSPVLACTLTTLAGTTSLLLADHPLVGSLGVVLGLGMVACLAATLLITPALAGRTDAAVEEAAPPRPGAPG